MEYFEDLVQALKDALEEHGEQQEQPHYNIFQVLGVSKKEVMMCRVLADLLNPSGGHEQGTKYLSSFLRDVLHMEITQQELSVMCVYKEYPISKDRRIDIVIQGGGHFIPIEVKITAVDQISQCYDYYQYARKLDETARVVYLTIWGSAPNAPSMSSSDGSQTLREENIQCISFAKDIATWLENSFLDEQGAMSVFLEQYLDAIRSFSTNSMEAHRLRIANKVLEREEYFRTALAVADSIKTIKARLIYMVFQEFEVQMEPYLETFALKKEHRFSWYEYPKQATEAFYNRDTTWPGINYVFQNVKLASGVEVWLRIEVYHEIYAGVCLFDPSIKTEEGMGDQVDEISPQLEQEVLQQLDLEVAKDEWWLTWWCLPTGVTQNVSSEAVPDFKRMNEAAWRLSNVTYRKEFVRGSVALIREKLQKMEKTQDRPALTE